MIVAADVRGKSKTAVRPQKKTSPKSPGNERINWQRRWTGKGSLSIGYTFWENAGNPEHIYCMAPFFLPLKNDKTNLQFIIFCGINHGQRLVRSYVEDAGCWFLDTGYLKG
jgi:hypothetical protein